ncbi:hypothetical protein [Brasilonema sp. UFV-L1]|uniref:hypothetical protein n=1 Tax=Brasilonema sp. UFV-L1 TaxID=2234130 RepID=UPI00145DFE79|nr:hypothetical protein [Brasilonema sp. UFV-L1]NMG09080.1 hypothetical protein [Brasilonema sp. UFV-L1]
MSTQFFLDENDMGTLAKLMLRSQQVRTREALCLRIGIDHRRLGFIKDSADDDFAIQLINYLNEISDKEALCKLCCNELFPVFHHGTYAPILSDIAAKLHCNQELSQNSSNKKQSTIPLPIPAPGVSVNPFNQLVKNKFITGGTIVLIGLAGFYLSNQNSNSSSAQPTLSAQPQISSHNSNLNCANISFKSSQKPSSAKVQILNPSHEECVEQLPLIQGKVTVPEANQVWIVVKPLTDNQPYYVQAPARVTNGEFQTQIHVGYEKTVPGTQFEIRAFVEPIEELKEGQKLDGWPKARWSSDVISVKRK